jgi:hypothetical protein
LLSIGRYRYPPRRNSTFLHATPCVQASVQRGMASAGIRRRSYRESNRVPDHGSFSPLPTDILRILALVASPWSTSCGSLELLLIH